MGVKETVKQGDYLKRPSKGWDKDKRVPLKDNPSL